MASETWRIDTGDRVREVVVTSVHRGLWRCEDGPRETTPVAAVRAYAHFDGRGGMAIAPGEMTRAELAAQLATATASVRQLRADVELATAQRDAETCRADNAECERDDLAATLETRTAEHALAMEQLAAVTAERDVALGQQAPLLDAHDALVAAARAAGWTGAGATGAELVAWVRRGGACEGAVAVRDAVMGYLDEIFPGGPAATDARWPHELMEHVACAVARVKRSVGGAT